MAKRKQFRKPEFYFNYTYRMNYYYYIGWPRESFDSYMLEKYNYDPEAIGVGKCIFLEHKKEKKRIIHIWTEKKTDYPTIAHECLHAANYTLDLIGWQPILTNDEPQTYLMTEIMRKALGEN